jgi:AcrR family transcriptional regulator
MAGPALYSGQFPTDEGNMAGHIRRRTIASNLDKIGEHTLLEKIASGMTMAGLARELGISNLSLYHWIKKDPDRQERFAQARAIAADQWAEECLDIADQADGVSANADRLKIETRKWLAGVTSPDKYRAAPTQANVQVNVNQMHLDALKQLNLGGDDKPAVEVEVTAPIKQIGSSNLDADDLPDPYGDDADDILG